MPDGAVGDVNSDTRGSGARYNSGKIPYDLIPLRLIAESLNTQQKDYVFTSYINALYMLGKWQETGEIRFLTDITTVLGPNGGWKECAEAFDYGRKKYSEWNWAKGMAWSIPLGCAARHLISMINGEEVDPESGCTHRGHVYCNLVMLQVFHRTFPDGDDRTRLLVPTIGQKKT